ncbi:hypothetical protein TNCV_65291 [Trichonephila clavipes]|nr:hypothetical protein TNCV_65291 [Trichonephila clavipes]
MRRGKWHVIYGVRRGVTKSNCSNIVNSVIRPNVSFAQAAKQERSTITTPAPQQMAPRIGQVPARNQTQAQAGRESANLPSTPENKY